MAMEERPCCIRRLLCSDELKQQFTAEAKALIGRPAEELDKLMSDWESKHGVEVIWGWMDRRGNFREDPSVASLEGVGQS